MPASSSRPDAKCPIRPGDMCTLCQPGATGPADCGLVYLVMTDPDLRAELTRLRREHAADRDAAGRPPGA